MNLSKKVRQMAVYFISVLVLTGFDQWTKYIAELKLNGNTPFVLIKDILEFSYLRNSGAAWGILSGNRIPLIFFTFIILFVIGVLVHKTPVDKKYTPFRIALVLISSGAVGNLIDRILNGYVDDFIYFRFINFPIFNVADMYVTFSMILLIILVLFIYKDNDFDFMTFKKQKKETDIDGKN